MKVSELIEYLQSLDNEDLIVYLKVSDDDYACYLELQEEEIGIEWVRDEDTDKETLSCILGEPVHPKKRRIDDRTG